MKELREERWWETRRTEGKVWQSLPYLLVPAITALIFAMDIHAPRGIALWVLYVVPIALACFLSRPWLPLAVAVLAVVLAQVGYAYDEPGVDPVFGRLNHVLVVSALSLVGMMGVLFVRMRQGLLHATEHALSTQTLRQDVLDSLDAHIAVLDRQGSIVSVNRAWRQFAEVNTVGAGHDSAYLGHSYLEVCARAHGEDQAVAQQALLGIQAVLNGDASHFSLEYPCHTSGVRHWFLMSVTPLCQGGGGAVIAHLNVTARKQAELALRESTEQLAMALKAARMATWHYDPGAERVTQSAATGPVAGIVPQSLQRSYEEFISAVHPDDRVNLDTRIKAAIAGGGSFSAEFRVLWADGSEHWLAQQGQAYGGTNTIPKHMAGVTWDVTKVKQAEKDLRDARDSLQRLAVSHNRAREDDHLRLARALHDEVGGHLAAMMMQIAALRERLRPQQEALAEVDSLLAATHTIIESLRRILNELCPPVLADLGLDAALQALGERLAQQSGTAVRVVNQAEVDRLDIGTATALYHIVQWVLNNLVRRTGAAEITVTQVRCDRNLCVFIEGDGSTEFRGDMSDAAASSVKAMSERALLLGGSLDIDNVPGRGTSIRLCVPMVEQPAH